MGYHNLKLFCCGVLHQKKNAVELYQSEQFVFQRNCVCLTLRTVNTNKIHFTLNKFRNTIRTSGEIRKPYTQTTYRLFTPVLWKYTDISQQFHEIYKFCILIERFIKITFKGINQFPSFSIFRIFDQIFFPRERKNTSIC